ncbi:hypothetical protein DFH28DRAFT_949399 [Melampsora americana]|nr:hypothetical protein DFH28DRAFT_949399 [Melampsora americana]
MSSSEESRLVNFISNISPEVNPYISTAGYLKNRLKPTAMPLWARLLQGFVGLAFFVLAYRACRIIYIRIKTKKFYFFKLNSLGLIKLDGLNHACVGYVLISTVASLDIVSREIALTGYFDQAWPDFILSIRSTFVSMVSWAFLWLCFCHCAILNFDPFEGKNSGQETLISPRWVMISNGCFLVMLFWLGVPVIWSSFQTSLRFYRIETTTSLIIDVLKKLAPTYSQSDYDYIQVLSVVAPLQSTSIELDHVIHYLHLTLLLYLIDAVLLCLAYPPVLITTIRSFHKYNKLSDSVKEKNQQIYWRGIIAFFTTLAHLPLNIWLLLPKGDDFLFSPTWWTICQLGLNIPIIVGCHITLHSLSKRLDSTIAIPSNCTALTSMTSKYTEA